MDFINCGRAKIKVIDQHHRISPLVAFAMREEKFAFLIFRTIIVLLSGCCRMPGADLYAEAIGLSGRLSTKQRGACHVSTFGGKLILPS